MRTMKFLSLVGMSVTLLLAGSCVPLKYVPKANEGTLGTWITEKTPRKTVVTAEGWKDFMFVDDPDPGMAGVGQIESKWTDSKGDIWYRKYITITQGDQKGQKLQILERISPAGTVKEQTGILVSDFRFRLFPKTIDPTAYADYKNGQVHSLMKKRLRDEMKPLIDGIFLA